MQTTRYYWATLMTLALTAFTVTACGETTPEKKGDAAPTTTAPAKPAATGNKAEYEAALAEAKDAQKRADTAKGEWRDLGKWLKEAEDAAKAEDYTKATKLAKKVKVQAELGIEQANGEKNAGHPSVLKSVKVK